VNFFFPSLKNLLLGLLFDHPPSLTFFFFFFSFPLFSLLSSLYLSISFSFLSFSLGFVSVNVVNQLILNYTYPGIETVPSGNMGRRI
jgi:hypothetical protein